MKKTLLITLCLFFFNSQAQQMSKLPPPGTGGITTHSHLISASGGCFTVWVGVFWTDSSSGEEGLLTYGTAQIGDCGRVSSGINPLCENKIYKEDYIYNSDYENLKYCLIDCLQDERVYNSYQKEKSEIINSIKK